MFNSNVTVIIPCFNDGEYIVEAINSILNQTLQAVKIIVVDDGSDFETQNVLKAINHPIVQIVQQQNRGVSNARNTAIILSQTDYILNLDADDYFEPSFIEKAVKILNNNSNIGIVGCFYRVLKGNVKKIELIKPIGGKVKDFLIKNNGLSSAMFRKKCWILVSGYDEKMAEGYEDWEFWVAILKKKWLMHIIQEPLFTYRQKVISRDQIALKEFDFELRKYIFLKHKEVFETHFELYVLQLLKQNSILRNNLTKTKNTKDFQIGNFLLAPLRFLKTMINLKK